MIFFFHDTAPTEIYTLSLHDALPISLDWHRRRFSEPPLPAAGGGRWQTAFPVGHRLESPKHLTPFPPDRWTSSRSEEHTSELQSRPHLVCRLLLEKKKFNCISLLLHS